MIVLGLTTTLLAATAPGGPAGDAAVRSMIQADYDKITAAEKTHNYDAISKTFTDICAPTFSIQPPDGKIYSLPEFLAASKPGWTDVKAAPAPERTVTKLVVTGDTATDENTATLTHPYVDKAGQLGTKGASHVVGLQRLYQSKWAKMDGAWKMTFTMVLKTKTLVDGKEYTPPPPPAPKSAPKAAPKRRY